METNITAKIASYSCCYVNISRPRPFLPLRVPRNNSPHVSKSYYMRFNAWQPLRAISSFRESLSINDNSSSLNIKGDVIRNKPIEAANSIWAFVSQMGKRLDNDSQKNIIIENNNNDDDDEIKENIEISENTKKNAPSIWRFLKPTPTMEVQLARVMASLSNLVYYMSKVTVSNMQFKSMLRRYGYHLVTTSLQCKSIIKESDIHLEAMSSADGMAVNEQMASLNLEDLNQTKCEKSYSNIVVATNHHDYHSHSHSHLKDISNKSSDVETKKNEEEIKEGWNVVNTVGVAGSMYSATMVQLAKQIMGAASFSQTAVSVTFGRVMGLLQAAINSSTASPGQQQQLSNSSTHYIPMKDNKDVINDEIIEEEKKEKYNGKCPGEWFVCDNPRHETRIFCIQGTDSLDAWHTNLKFDPVQFEEESLGVLAHRGAYEAAKSLYHLFKPLITDYIEEHPNGKISFTGHSLGGAISSLLILMYVNRGILEKKNVGHVYTFGGAASICDGSHCICTELNDNTMHKENECKCKSVDILEKLDLPLNTIINVVMHKDIVPRAYACDYSPVAKFLASWGSSFKSNTCLNKTGRPLLYSFPGEMHILQPEKKRKYVKNEGYHFMLPYGAGLYKIADPDPPLANPLNVLQSLAEGTSNNTDKALEVKNTREAILAFMDNPHPLEILSDKSAYGDVGSISRYHNPANYANAIQSVLTARRHSAIIPFGPSSSSNTFIDNEFSKHHSQFGSRHHHKL